MNKKFNKYIAVTIGVVVILFFVFITDMFGLFNNENNSGATPGQGYESSPSGLKFQNTLIGEGLEAKEGMLATVNYVGSLKDGTVFDSSYERGEVFQFVIGAGQVIKGFEEGVAGMKVGGKRVVEIPPELGYSEQEIPGIPANSTLVFEIELMGVQEFGNAQNNQ